MPSGHLTFVQDLTKICPSEFADAFVRLFSFSSSFAAVGLGIVIKFLNLGLDLANTRELDKMSFNPNLSPPVLSVHCETWRIRNYHKLARKTWQYRYFIISSFRDTILWSRVTKREHCKKECFLSGIAQITSPPPPNLGKLYNFFGRQKRRFYAYYRTNDD